jgi:hypothetical protein
LCRIDFIVTVKTQAAIVLGKRRFPGVWRKATRVPKSVIQVRK